MLRQLLRQVVSVQLDVYEVHGQGELVCVQRPVRVHVGQPPHLGQYRVGQPRLDHLLLGGRPSQLSIVRAEAVEYCVPLAPLLGDDPLWLSRPKVDALALLVAEGGDLVLDVVEGASGDGGLLLLAGGHDRHEGGDVAVQHLVHSGHQLLLQHGELGEVAGGQFLLERLQRGKVGGGYQVLFLDLWKRSAFHTCETCCCQADSVQKACGGI